MTYRVRVSHIGGALFENNRTCTASVVSFSCCAVHAKSKRCAIRQLMDRLKRHSKQSLEWITTSVVSFSCWCGYTQFTRICTKPPVGTRLKRYTSVVSFSCWCVRFNRCLAKPACLNKALTAYPSAERYASLVMVTASDNLAVTWTT